MKFILFISLQKKKRVARRKRIIQLKISPFQFLQMKLLNFLTVSLLLLLRLQLLPCFLINFQVIQPGFYDIETEMCTPELQDVREYIPREIERNVADKRPVRNFKKFLTINFIYLFIFLKHFFIR